MHQAIAMPFAKVAAHRVLQLVIVTEPIQVLEHGVDAFGHLRHTSKALFFGGAIDQHAGTPPCACFCFSPSSLTSPAFFHTVIFPSLIHVVSSRSTGPISHRILVLVGTLSSAFEPCLNDTTFLPG